jgi:hypothetical protein
MLHEDEQLELEILNLTVNIQANKEEKQKVTL